jgi:Coenzyme PQQ synthesis protein D (PqqD)
MEEDDMTELKLRDAGVAWKEVDGEVVALDEREAVYLAANPAGAVLWRALASGATHDALVDGLVSTFGIATDRASADVDAFITDLRERGLLD